MRFGWRLEQDVQDIEGFTANSARNFVDSTEGRVLHKQQIDVVDARSMIEFRCSFRLW